MTSRVAEIAREEAAEAEAENPDAPETLEAPEPPGEPEPTPEPPEGEPAPEPPAPPPTEAQIDAMWKALEREAVRHQREVEKRAGPMFAELAPCPLCQAEGATPGYIFPTLPEPMQTMRREGVALALGGQAPVEYEPDTDAQACERCNALGKLQTGSKVPGQETRICPDCNGQGWKAKLPQPPVFTPTVVPPPTPPPQPFAAGNGVGPDQWGRMPGQPNYGQHPSVAGW